MQYSNKEFFLYFIGSGSLLYQAINHCLDIGVNVDGACCPPEDSIFERLRKKGVPVLKSVDPNMDRALIVGESSDGVVFSINNKHFLNDDLISGGVRFYNIHNGLIQQYRGIAEVCIFAALCRGDEKYGVTLQQLLPGQGVDTGPVVSQLSFGLTSDDVFASVFEKSLRLCQEIFELNVRTVLSDSVPVVAAEAAATVWSYKDVVALGVATPPESLQRASELGHYSVFLPKLQAKINQIPRMQS